MERLLKVVKGNKHKVKVDLPMHDGTLDEEALLD